jgi:1-acyl-sn-glycerol-3-phosphate acyltransferase
LLGQSVELTGPHPWQIGVPARAVRRLGFWLTYTRRAKAMFTTLRIDGKEHFAELAGPAVFIANHSSHLDTLALMMTLPPRYRRRVAWPAAADRWYVKGRKGVTKQGWWRSLVLNTVPMRRGGGSAALDYTKWLIDKKWSIVIFPEGTRSRTGKLGRFRAGPAILAIEKGLPVVPIFMKGLYEIRPSGTRESQPGPVHVKVGEPVRFPPGTDIGTATKTLYRALTALRD